MELTFADSYQKGASNFPSDRISPSQKRDDEYYRKCAQSILTRYVTGGTHTQYQMPSGKRSVAELRSYASGTNSVSKYQDILIGKKGNQQASRKTSLNISWDIIQVIPQFVDVVRGYMQKFSYSLLVNAIDPDANADKEQLKAEIKLYLDEEYKKFAFTVNNLLGSKVAKTESDNPQAPGVQFNTPQEVDFFDSIGGFILEQESSLKTLLELTEDRSGFDSIKDQLIKDAIIAGQVCMHVYAEAGSPIIKYEYVDLEGAIIPWSIYDDHRDMTYFGNVRKITIAEIRARYDVTEDELLRISRMYNAKMNNPAINSADWNNFRSVFYEANVNAQIIDSTLVDVIDCCWISTDYQRMTMMRREKDGNLVLNNVDDDYELKEKDAKKGKTVKEFSQQTLYECAMVVGSNTILSSGKPNNISYKESDTGQREVIFPYISIRTGSSSLVERCVAFADDIQLAYLKLRNALKKAIPSPGMLIDESALKNVMVNGVSMSPKAIMQMLQDEGYAVVSSTNEFGDKNTNIGNVITFLPDHLFEQINAVKTLVEYAYSQMQRVTGINDLFSASTPSAETGVGVAKISISSTENTLFPIVNTYKQAYEKAAGVAAIMWQINDFHTKKEQSLPYFAKNAVKYVTLGGQFTYKSFGIRIKAGLDNIQKTELLNEIRQLRDLRTQSGAGGITPSTYFMLYQVIQSGNLEKAMLLLAQAEERQQQQDQQKAMANSQQTAQLQQQSAQATSQGKIQEMQMQGQIDKDIKLSVQQAEMVRETTKLQQLHGAQTAQNQSAAQQVAAQNAAQQQHEQQLEQQKQAQAAQLQAQAHSEKLKEIALQNIYGKNASPVYSENPYQK